MPRRNTIMFVTNTLAPGGSEHTLIDLARGLDRNSPYRPIVVTLQEPGPLAQILRRAGIEVCDRLLNGKYDFMVIRRLAALIADRRVGIIVPVGSGGDRMFWATLAAAATSAKTVVWSHSFSQPGHGEFETANRMIYPLVHGFVALGRRHQRSLKWFDKVPAGRITVIPTGIRIQRFDHPEWRDRARAILGLADENVTAIAIIARLRPDKRHDLFIEAARQVVKHRRHVHFFIIGDGPERENVKRWADQSELLGQYLSLLGHREDIAQLLPGLDLVCLCSEYHQCLSVVALQAMAARVPVLSHFIGSMDEAITDNQTGFFFHQLSAHTLAQKMIDVIDEPELRHKVAENAYRLAKQKFTAERMINDFIRLFDNLLAGRASRQIG